MTINERVSDERLSTLANLQSHECMALPAGHNEVAMMARELQQYRAAAEPVCPKCGGTGMADSGGFYPWGEPIFIECDCHAVPQLPQPVEPEITSEELDDELLEQLIDFRRSMLNHHRKEGNKVQTVMHGMVLRVMLELQERRAATLTAAPAVQAGQEPIYQLRDVDWYDTDKRTYDTVVNTGGAGRIVYAAPQLPQPAVVPDAIEIDDDFDSAFEHGKAVGWNAYRAAMLQGTERVSQPYTLPAHSPCADAPDHIWLQTAGEWPASGEFGELTWSCDNQHPDDTLYVRADLVGNSPCYLQGYKDGCEWSALMAEANHPQTGDWLFNDPIELAKAIRKGPDMLPVEPGNSPAIPDGWIPVSERMPEQGRYISAVSRHGEYVSGLVEDDWLDLHDGTSFGLGEVYLWLPLPELSAAPKQEVKAAFEMGMSRYGDAMQKLADGGD